MSDIDSGEDLGGFAPVTPHPLPKRTKKARVNGKPISRNNGEAGPSSKTTKTPLARKRATATRSKPIHNDSDEVQEVVQDVEPEEGKEVDAESFKADEPEDEDVQMVHVLKPRKAAALGTGGAAPKSTAKGRGKAKLPPPKLTKKTPPESEAIDVDALAPLQESDDEMSEVAQAASIGLSKKEHISREVAKLQERLRRSQEHVQSLIERLEETQRTRETEAEKMLKAVDAQHKAEITAKDALIEALTSQLAQKETSVLHGKRSILHMITREAADEEKRTLEGNVAQLKGSCAQNEEGLKKKDAQIAELKSIEQELRVELKAEIDRSKALSEKSLRNPQLAVRSRPGGAFEDPKNAEVIRFYEDLTNMLVTSMKHQAGERPGADEWTLKCIYTYSEDSMVNNSMQKSVAFTLRTTHAAKHDSDPRSDDQSIHYTPEDLDKESLDFVEKLDYLGQPFTFSRRQLSLFLRTLYDKLKEACGKEDELEDDEVQIIEK